MKTPTPTPEVPAPAAVPHINVTPLIDVLLVLLIIFMVITPLRPSRFKALIPQPPQHDLPLPPNDGALIVTINKDLSLMLNRLPEGMGSVNDTTKLSTKLADVFAQRERSPAGRLGFSRVEKTVMLVAPRSINYGSVAKVIDGIKGSGASPIGLAIDDLTQ